MSLRKPLTEKQAAVLRAIEACQARYGKATTRQIKRELGLKSTGTVYKHLKMLERHGYLRSGQDGIHLYPAHATDLSKYHA